MITKIINRADFIILLSTFLPYLIINEGIRIEHMVVYTFFAIFFLKGLIFNFKTKSFLPIVFMFFVIILLVSIGSFVNNERGDLTFLSNFKTIWKP